MEYVPGPPLGPYFTYVLIRLVILPACSDRRLTDLADVGVHTSFPHSAPPLWMMSFRSLLGKLKIPCYTGVWKSRVNNLCSFEATAQSPDRDFSLLYYQLVGVEFRDCIVNSQLVSTKFLPLLVPQTRRCRVLITRHAVPRNVNVWPQIAAHHNTEKDQNESKNSQISSRNPDRIVF